MTDRVNCAMFEKPAPIFQTDAFYDAGDKGCASNILADIRQMIGALQAAQHLEIRSTEPSIAIDLAAWCRLTGHLLIAQQPASDGARHYLIQRKQ